MEGQVALVMGDAPSVDLALATGITPTTSAGTTIYFGANEDIDGMLARVEEAGGRILEPKSFMGEMVGWIAFVVDTEGNRIGIRRPATRTGA